MNINEEDEKIVRARVLLKKFQTKQMPMLTRIMLHQPKAVEDISRQCSHGSTPVSLSAETTGINHAELLLHDQLLDASIDKCHSLPKFVGIENDEIKSIRNALAHRQQELNESQSKLRDLHRHYVELHSAYNRLAGEHDQNKVGPEQLQHLRMALSIALDEKMSLQNELRELKSDSQKRGEEAELKYSETKSNGHNSYDPTVHELESKLNCLAAERDHLAQTVASQSTQIEHHRRECSNLEAKMMLMQQDRIDAQGRIKSLYATKTQLEATIEQQQNDLSMRDIYIKQFSRHTGIANQSFEPNVQHSDGASLHSQESRKRLEDELGWHKERMAELQKKMQLVQEQHQSENAQSNAHIQRLGEELDSLRSQNANLESSNNFLEEQLRILRKQLDETILLPSTIDKQQTNSTEPQMDLTDELEQLKNAVIELTTEKNFITTKLRETELLAQQKENCLEEMKQSLDDVQSRISHFEQLQTVQSTMNTDVSLLSAQLQNEKATVSRADRLIVVINESAAKEDERLSALAAVERLSQQLSSNEKLLSEKEIIPKEDNDSKSHEALLVEQCQQTEADDILLAVPYAGNETRTPWMAERSCNSSCDIGLQTEPEQGQTEKNCLENALLSSGEQLQQSPLPNCKSIEEGRKEPNDLANRLETLCRENELYRSNNEKLEYCLTVLESENESIGEYIALYRFQRSQVQQRIAEKDSALHQLQQHNLQLMAFLSELRNAVLAVMQNNNNKSRNGSGRTEQTPTSEEAQFTTTPMSDAEAVSVEQNQHQSVTVIQREHSAPLTDDAMGRLMRILERSEAISRQATCLAAHQAQIHCTGCVECQGELFTL
uniref:Golgin subfamily A conserved domain-containing protein n=1 Tax=Globodera rostochiensis TaxID=31243 RepID=A0A914I5A0_GLORO